MKVAFTVLAAAAVLAFTDGTTKEDLSTYISSLERYTYRSGSIINADQIGKVTLKANNDYSYSGEARFTPTSAPMGGQDPKCGNLLGVQLGKKTFCGLSYMTIVQNQEMRSGSNLFGIYLEFKSPSSPNDILKIYTHVFTTPDGLEGKALQDWGRDREVLVSPIDEADLSGLLSTKTITLKLDWVSKLAEWGLYEDVRFPLDDGGFLYEAGLRPIAVSQSFLNQLERVHKKFKNSSGC